MPNIFSTQLNGTSQWWSIASGSQTGLDFTGDCSFEYWFKPSAINRNQGGICQWYNNGTGWVGVMFWISAADRLQLRIIDSSVNITQYTSTAVVYTGTGTWAHYAGTFDASAKTMALYKDGSPISATVDSQNAGAIDNDANWEIGSRNNGLLAAGEFDEARIWNVIRTPAEILAKYKKQLLGTETGLQAYLRFNNNGDDETSNNNDFTNNGTATFTNDVPFIPSYDVTANTASYYSLSVTGRNLVRTDDGVLHTTYALALSGKRAVYYANSSDDGETWGNQTLLASVASYDQQNPTIALDSSGNLHVAYSGRNATYPLGQTFYVKYTKSTSSWGSPVNLINANYQTASPTICVDNNDDVHIAWCGRHSGSTSIRQLRYIKQTSGSWGSIQNLTSQATDQDLATVVAGPNGNIHITYSGVYGSYINVRHIKYTTSWQTPETVSTNAGSNQYSNIAIADNEDLHVTWSGEDPSYTQVFYRMYDDSTSSWGTEQKFTSGNYHTGPPQIAIDDNDKLTLSWHGVSSSSPTYRQIWLKIYDGSWGSNIQMTSGSSNQSYPRLIYSIYPTMGGAQTCRAAEGYAFVWQDEGAPNVKFFKSTDLAWQEAAYEFSGDASLKQEHSDTFAGDASLKALLQNQWESFSNLTGEVLDTFTGDAEIIATLSATFTGNSYLYDPDLAHEGSPWLYGTQYGGWWPDKITYAQREFAGDANMIASSQDTFTADANLRNTFDTPFFGDANLLQNISRTFTGDASLKAVASLTFTSDTNLVRTISPTFDGDASLKSEDAELFTGNANLKKTEATSFSGDASFLRIESSNFTGDAALLRVIMNTFTGKANLLRSVGGSFQGYANLTGEEQTSFTSDANLKKTDATYVFTGDTTIMTVVSALFTGDGSFLREITSVYSGDANLTGERSAVYTGDASIVITLADTFTGDANILRLSQNQWTGNANLVSEVSQTFTSDAAIVGATSNFFLGDSNLTVLVSDQFTGDASILFVEERIYTGDANLYKTETQTYTGDADLSYLSVTSTYTGDANLIKTLTSVYTSDASLITTLVNTWTGDACFIKEQAGFFTSDADLVGAAAVIFTGDTNLKVTKYLIFRSYASILRLIEDAFTSNSSLLRTVTDTYTANANLFKTEELTYTGDASLLASTIVDTFTGDASMIETVPGLFDGDASLLLADISDTFTGDAAMISVDYDGFAGLVDADVTASTGFAGTVGLSREQIHLGFGLGGGHGYPLKIYQ